MVALTWDDPTKRLYAHGIDRGVLYVTGKDPVPWNGITAVDESSNGSSTVLYRDGVIFMADADPGDFTGQLSALFYPDNFAECLGMPMAADGLFVDNQKPKHFSLSYRTLIGSGAVGDQFGYQIHLLYNAVALIGDRNRVSDSDKTDPMPFTFNLTATPSKLAGYRPTAHYVIDTRFLSADTIATIENGLYGTPTTTGAMPVLATLFDTLNYGDSIEVHDMGDGFLSISGAYANVQDNLDGSGTINNINATTDGDGYITITSDATTIFV